MKQDISRGMTIVALKIASLLPACLLLIFGAGAIAADASEPPAELLPDRPPQPPQAVSLSIEPSPTAKPLNPNRTVWLDIANKKVVLSGYLCLREGLLEMLVCKKKTKEHESIIAIDADAYVIHAALIALGAQSGTPVQFQPEFQPPTGQKIDIFVSWTDDYGRPHRYAAQQLIRKATQRYYTAVIDPLPKELNINNRGDLRYDTNTKELIWFGRMTEEQKLDLLSRSLNKEYRAAIENFFASCQPQEMQADFVFTGSQFFRQKDGTQYYMAEAGDIICVANFGDAMIDIAARSSADAGGLLFEPYTERLPNRSTAITVDLIPVGLKDAASPAAGKKP